MANGDSIDTIVQRMNDSFSSQGMHLSATKTAGGQMQIVVDRLRNDRRLQVSYTPGAGGSGVAALGIAAQKYSGLDVAGTINGVAATGKGQYLTGASTDDSAGLIVRYTGTTARSAGTLALSLGVGGLQNQIATGLTASNTGSIALEITQTQTSADNLQIADRHHPAAARDGTDESHRAIREDGSGDELGAVARRDAHVADQRTHAEHRMSRYSERTEPEPIA